MKKEASLGGWTFNLKPLLNLSTHPTPLRRKGGPFQGKDFVTSQLFLTYELDALLYNKECDVEPLIESLKPLASMSWEGKKRRGKSLFLASSFKSRKGEKVRGSLK